MEEKVERSKNMFKSARLMYSSIEETDESCLSFLTELKKNPTNKMLGTFGAIKPPSKKTAQDFIAMLSKAALAVLICLQPTETDAEKKDGKGGDPIPIGYISLSNRWEKGYSIGLEIAPEYQNKGLGREAINWVLDWAFLWGSAHRVNIGTIAFNTRAAKLYESIGFVLEGRVRSAAWSDGQWHDLLEFSILDHEWKELRKLDQI